jgi:hypothetical protein
MPDARIIYWEAGRKTPEAVRIRFIFPDKTEHAYNLPTVKMLQMSLEDVEAKNLVLLAPFYVLKYRQAVKRSSDSGKRRVLAAGMGELLGKLEALLGRNSSFKLLEAFSREEGKSL